MPFVDNLDFLNLNSLRAYPLKEGVTKKSIDTNLLIPDNFIVDATFSFFASVEKRLYISRITNNSSVIVVEISDELNEILGTFDIDCADHVRKKDYYFTPSESNVDAGFNGKMVVDTLDHLLSQANGTFSFAIEAAEFESRVVIPSISNITRLKFVDKDSQHLFSVSGDVVLQARTNLKFTKLVVSGTTYIVLDAGNGLGLNQACPGDKPCIKSINGLQADPDDDYNFTLDGDSCLQITNGEDSHGLVLNETCCKPCVGCDEIGQITERLIQIEADLLKLKDYYNQLNALSTQLGNLIGFSCDCPGA